MPRPLSRKRVAETIRCIDVDGRQVEVVKIQEEIKVSLLSGSVDWVLGGFEFQTRDGAWVNEQDDGTYELKDGRTVRRAT